MKRHKMMELAFMSVVLAIILLAVRYHELILRTVGKAVAAAIVIIVTGCIGYTSLVIFLQKEKDDERRIKEKKIDEYNQDILNRDIMDTGGR